MIDTTSCLYVEQQLLSLALSMNLAFELTYKDIRMGGKHSGTKLS